MRNILFYIFILYLGTLSCSKRQTEKDDMPSCDLIDTVITSAITMDSINIFSSLQGKKNEILNPILQPIPYNLHSALKEWSTSEKFSFDFTYITEALLRQNGLRIFTSKDSAFMSHQIANIYPDTLHLMQLQNISYINDSQIDNLKKAKNKSLRLRYCQFSKPLFNLNRSITIIGVSFYNYDIYGPHQHKSGYYLILKRVNKKWIKLYDLDWWGN
jgi:hypothetical protein